jgi:iron complex transport system ATP-binding protein
MLEINRLSVRRAARTVFSDLSLTLPRGSMTALIGKNGCGKSTLLSAIGGTCPYEGEILLDGIPTSALSPKELAKRMSHLPQTLAAPHMTVEELVRLGRHPHVGMLSRPTDADGAAVHTAMEQADVTRLSNRYLDEISGGERQRAYLAMLLSHDAPLWLLDEPTTYMDPSVAAHFTVLLTRLKQEHAKTLLVAMHDLSSAVRFADHIALLDGGRLAFFGTTEDCLSTDAIERTFSVRRLEAHGETFFIGEPFTKTSDERNIHQ